mgnify:CR=1 FL=1
MNRFQILKQGIAHIKKIREADEKISSALKFLNDDFNYFSFAWVEEDYLKLLELAVGDFHGNISYFIYDCDFGKSPHKVIINTSKGEQTIMLKTVEELYKIINS